LSTNPEIIQYLEENKNMITAPVPDFLLKKDKFIYVVPDQISDIRPEFAEFKKRFKVGGVVNVIERRQGYYDQFGFNTGDDFSVMANVCANDMEQIQRFISIFKDKTTQLVQTAARECRYTLDPTRISNIRGLSSHKSVNRLGFSIQFSKREIECIAFIMMGLTIPEMGTHMSLSPRTVEYYINNIKSKLGCFRKAEVLTQIKRMKLDSLYETEFESVLKNYMSQSDRSQLD
jgi:DNA-binding CsgD family transcriptional regulator